jgi:hypothetical protein
VTYSAFLCVWGTKHRCIIFLARVGSIRFHKKHVGTRYGELVFLHLMGSASHVVHSSASRAQNVDTLFFMLRWDWYGFYKKLLETHYDELMFLHPVGSTHHVVYSSASRPPSIDALFFMLR